MKAKKRKQSKLGDITDANVATIKRKEKAWTCNLHEIAGHRRVYCRKAKQKEIKGCDEGHVLKMVSFGQPGRYLQKEGYCYVHYCCYENGKPRRCFQGNIPEDEFFQIVSPYLEQTEEE